MRPPLRDVHSIDFIDCIDEQFTRDYTDEQFTRDYIDEQFTRDYTDEQSTRDYTDEQFTLATHRGMQAAAGAVQRRRGLAWTQAVCVAE